MQKFLDTKIQKFPSGWRPWNIQEDVMLFTFNAVELSVVIINEKPWTRAKKICRALEYGKATKSAAVVRHLCSREKYAHEYQLNELVSKTSFMDWPKDSRKDGYYINEERDAWGVIFKSTVKSKRLQKTLLQSFLSNVSLFPCAWQQVTNKIKEDHQQAIDEKHAALTLPINDLQGRVNRT